MNPSADTLLARALDQCLRRDAECLRLETDNAKMRGRIKTLEAQNQHYREMASEAYSAMARQLRGEPIEGWLDPQPREPDSNTKLRARLNQSKSVSHARYEQLKRQAALRRAAEDVAKAVHDWAARASSPPRLWAGDEEQRMLDTMAVWMTIQ